MAPFPLSLASRKLNLLLFKVPKYHWFLFLTTFALPSPGFLALHPNCACLLSHSVVSDSLQPQWTVACQPSLSMGFVRQERILEWVAMFYCRGPSQPRDQTCVSCITRQILHHYAWEVGREATQEALLPKLGEPQTSSSTIRVETSENTRNMCLNAGGLCKGQLESLLDNISSLSYAFGQRSGPSSSSLSRWHCLLLINDQ